MAAASSASVAIVGDRGEDGTASSSARIATWRPMHERLGGRRRRSRRIGRSRSARRRASRCRRRSGSQPRRARTPPVRGRRRSRSSSERAAELRQRPADVGWIGARRGVGRRLRRRRAGARARTCGRVALARQRAAVRGRSGRRTPTTSSSCASAAVLRRRARSAVPEAPVRRAARVSSELGARSSGRSGGSSAAPVASAAPSSAARLARAWYSGPCLRGSAYSFGLSVQYVPLVVPYQLAPRPVGLERRRRRRRTRSSRAWPCSAASAFRPGRGPGSGRRVIAAASASDAAGPSLARAARSRAPAPPAVEPAGHHRLPRRPAPAPTVRPSRRAPCWSLRSAIGRRCGPAARVPRRPDGSAGCAPAPAEPASGRPHAGADPPGLRSARPVPPTSRTRPDAAAGRARRRLDASRRGGPDRLPRRDGDRAPTATRRSAHRRSCS